MSTTIQLRGDTSGNWFSVNPILHQRELALETDTMKYKIGDGVSPWNSLPYAQLSGNFDTIPLNTIEDPTAPGSGLLLYTKTIAGKNMPKFIGPSGIDSILQPHFGGNGIQMAGPGTSTALSYFGMGAFTAVGTVSHPVISATSFAESIRRARIASATTANSASELRLSVAPAMRGNSAQIGGFYCVTRFGVASTVATQRLAVGLWASVSATSTSSQPSAIVNGIWVGNDLADANLQIMYNDASGVASKIDLGSEFNPLDVNAVFDATFFCAKGGTEVFYRVMELNSGAMVEGSVTTDLPVSTTPITPHFYMNNGGTAASVLLEVYRYYLESDF